MPRHQRIYLTACAMVIGFVGAYCLVEWAALPRLTYFPLEGEWQLWSRLPGPVPMGYVGMILWGLGGALIAAAAVWLVAGRVATTLSDNAVRLVGAWTLSAFALGGGFFTWNLWPF
jgi:hypothetical protein